MDCSSIQEFVAHDVRSRIYPCCGRGPPRTPPAVPCLRRAADMEGGYNPNSEFTLQGEEGWVATHSDPTASGAAARGEEDIPSIDDDESAVPVAAGAVAASAEGGGSAADKDKDGGIPDITELELNEGEDEVSG